MKINNFSHSLKEALTNIVRHPLVSFASLTTIALTLIIVSVFSVFMMNATTISQRVKQSPPVELYAEIGISDERLAAIEAALKSSSYVKDAQHLTPDENYKFYQDSMGDNRKLLQGLSREQFPHSFLIHLKNPSDSEAFSHEMYQYLGVRKIRFDTEVISFLASTGHYVYIGSLLAFAVLIVISFFIISNMVRLSVFSRGDEISIMKYIGATDSFIRFPYVLEGIIVGILGALLSSVAVFFAYRAVYAHLMSGVSETDLLSLISPSAIILRITLLVLALGVVVGSLGSAISVRRHINV